MANTDNSNTPVGPNNEPTGEHVTNARVLADVQADIKSGPGTGAKPKPAPAMKHRATLPAKGGRKR